MKILNKIMSGYTHRLDVSFFLFILNFMTRKENLDNVKANTPHDITTLLNLRLDRYRSIRNILPFWSPYNNTLRTNTTQA